MAVAKTAKKRLTSKGIRKRTTKSKKIAIQLIPLPLHVKTLRAHINIKIFFLLYIIRYKVFNGNNNVSVKNNKLKFLIETIKSYGL